MDGGRRLAVVALATLLPACSGGIAGSDFPSTPTVTSSDPLPSDLGAAGREIHLGPGIGRLITAFGAVWVVEPGGVARVDIDTGRVRHIDVGTIVLPGRRHVFAEYGGRPDGSGLASGGGSVWVTVRHGCAEISPEGNVVVRRLPWGSGVIDVAFVGGRLLHGGMAEGNGYLTFLDTVSLEFEGRPSDTTAFPRVLATEAWYWAAGQPDASDGSDRPVLVRWSRDFASQQAVAGISEVDSFAEAGGSLWVTGEDRLYQVDLGRGQPPASPQSVFPETVDAVIRSFPVRPPAAVASDGESLWLLERRGGGGVRLSELDAATGAIVSGIEDPEHDGPAELTVVRGDPWVSFREDGVLVAFRRTAE